MEKINGKFAPIFKLKTFHWLTPTSVSQACYFPPFFHFYFFIFLLLCLTPATLALSLAPKQNDFSPSRVSY